MNAADVQCDCMRTDKQQIEFSLAWAGVLMVLIFAFALCLTWYVVYRFYPDDLDNAAKFGDACNFANMVMSSLAFAGVVAALILQQREIQYQRRDIEMTQRIATESATAQAEIARIQERSEEMQFIRGYVQTLDTLAQASDRMLYGVDQMRLKVWRLRSLHEVNQYIEFMSKTASEVTKIQSDALSEDSALWVADRLIRVIDKLKMAVHCGISEADSGRAVDSLSEAHHAFGQIMSATERLLGVGKNSNERSENSQHVNRAYDQISRALMLCKDFDEEYSTCALQAASLCSNFLSGIDSVLAL
ncbi:hypothetical protein Mal4_27750 [Maioricimonas rarisocia]|uniref:Uncharacterized protein n=1 Tax=Maioricimonas rarisocia TaxID=2528026 RepID=A0A517Z7J2_9PLAN|nr:hypothetical protein [Maioricimonas rarisocia]QDU38448.1 hypothetical protein Mal4_27750 [Maioricimonas rarisocia]